MIDNFALAVSHGLILLAFWRLLQRPDLEKDDAAAVPKRGFLHNAAPPQLPEEGNA